MAKFELDHPYRGTKRRWGRLNSAISDELLAVTRKRYKIDA